MNVYNLSVDALSCLYLKMGVTVKGIVHPKMYILSSFTHSQAAAISLRLQGKLSFPYNCQKMNGQIYVLLC